MIDTLLQIVAPHHCSGCDKIGTLLCENCKNDIVHDAYLPCVSCHSTTSVENGLCRHCKNTYRRAWCVGKRHLALERLIDLYKFSYAKQASQPLADLLHETLPELPQDTVIIPVPTTRAHIRQRGYDHIELIARRFSKARHLTYIPCLTRATSTQQKQANIHERTTQAKQAFTCQISLDPETPYLLIDDVMTTGSTLLYAAKKLRQSGAKNISIATISRQVLD